MNKLCRCGNTDKWTGLEYRGDAPEHYDGISEWHCEVCGTRYGRWTGDILEDGDVEKRYGGNR